MVPPGPSAKAEPEFKIDALFCLQLRQSITGLHYQRDVSRQNSYKIAREVIRLCLAEGGFCTFTYKQLGQQIGVAPTALPYYLRAHAEIGLFHRQEFFVIGDDGQPKKLHRLILGPKAKEMIDQCRDSYSRGPAFTRDILSVYVNCDSLWEG